MFKALITKQDPWRQFIHRVTNFTNLYFVGS